MITLILIIVVIVLIVNRHSNKEQEGDNVASEGATDSSQMSEEMQKLNEQILEELDKSEPDYEKLKDLRAEMEELKEAEVLSPAQPPQDSIISSTAENTSVETGVNGLSIALYVGSLLILAGVSGLVFSGAQGPGLAILILMTIIFYGGGVLARKNKTLKMASYVFVGTGMLMLPFLGILIQNITKVNAEIIWLVMSLVGVPMYIFATYIMQSKVFSYFAIAGFVSLSCSLASVMGLALVWYFVFVMFVGIGLNIVSVLSSSTKLGVMQEAFQQTGEWLPLVTLVASLMAMPHLREIDYVIILGITILHLIMEYIFRPDLAKEILLRAMLPALIILVVHLFSPTVPTIGFTLAGVALIQVLIAFYNVSRDSYNEVYRRGAEIWWLIISMACFIVAGALIGNGKVSDTWILVSAALIIDLIILITAKFVFRHNAWYFGLLGIGIALPITITSAIGLPMSTASPTCAAIYLLEIYVMEMLFWKSEETNGDVAIMISAGTLGIASNIAGWGYHMTSATLLMVATCFWIRGIYRKSNAIKEIAIYCTALGIYFLLDQFDLGIDWNNKLVLLGHIMFGGFIASSIMQDNYDYAAFKRNEKTVHARLLIGCIVLLALVGGAAISGLSWAMYIFLLETVGILLAGVFLKDDSLRVVGAIGAFLAVLWFTKDLSFVWPIMLGLGIIGIVIIILIRNNKIAKE